MIGAASHTHTSTNYSSSQSLICCQVTMRVMTNDVGRQLQWWQWKHCIQQSKQTASFNRTAQCKATQTHRYVTDMSLIVLWHPLWQCRCLCEVQSLKTWCGSLSTSRIMCFLIIAVNILTRNSSLFPLYKHQNHILVVFKSRQVMRHNIYIYSGEHIRALTVFSLQLK